MKKKNIVLIYIIQVIILIGLLFIGYNIIRDNIKSDKSNKKEDNEKINYKDLPLNELQKEIGSILDSISSEKYTLYLDLYSGKKEKHIVIYHSDNIEKIDIVEMNSFVTNYLDYYNKVYYSNDGNGNYSKMNFEFDSALFYLKELFSHFAMVISEDNPPHYTITFYDEPISNFVKALNNLSYMDNFSLKLSNKYHYYGIYEKVSLYNNNDSYQFEIHTGKNDFMTIAFTDIGVDNNISLPN